MESDLSTCLVLNTVMAARALLRRYDERLKPLGIGVLQFTVLMAVRKQDAQTVTAMAQDLSLDRTTLIRNLDVLRRKKLVSATRADKGNGRLFTLTPEGEAVLDVAIPAWHRAQRELANIVGDDKKQDLIGVLRQLAAG